MDMPGNDGKTLRELALKGLESV